MRYNCSLRRGNRGSATTEPIVAAMKPLLDIIFGFEGFEFVAFWLGLFIALTAAGFLIDMMMGRQGFGPLLNGLLALAGVFGGVYLRYSYLFRAPYTSYEPYVTMALCFGGPAVLIVGLAFVRNRLGG